MSFRRHHPGSKWLSIGLLSLCLAAGTRAAEPSARKLVVAYVPNWIDLPAFARTIDYAKLTHVNVAFENPIDDQPASLSYHRKDDALVRAAHAHGVKVLVSIGGGSASENKAMRARYATLTAEAHRPAFIATLADYLAAHDFDGLDVDLEGPSIGADYGPFVHDLGTALKAKGRLLTAAVSMGYGGKQIPDAALASFDFVNLMAYDATGDWDPHAPGQHSSLDYAHQNVAHWLARGLPKSKVVLGVPFYGYGFDDAYRHGDYAYAEIVASYPGAERTDQVGHTIWYNGIPTIRTKAQYVLDADLAGVMIWSLDSDAKGEASLLNAIDDVLRPTKRP